MSGQKMEINYNDEERNVLRYALSELVELLKSPTSADRDASAEQADRNIEVANGLLEKLKSKEKSSLQPRVLVVVSGGIADPVYDLGVDVEVFDWDNYKDDPKRTGGVPARFADLAGPCSIPVEPEQQTLMSEWKAQPGKGQEIGRIVALSDTEVIQDAGRQRYVSWDRKGLQDQTLVIGEQVTISEKGVVQRHSPDKAQGLSR